MAEQYLRGVTPAADRYVSNAATGVPLFAQPRGPGRAA